MVEHNLHHFPPPPPHLGRVKLGTIRLRRQHVLGGRGVHMGQWSKGHGR